MPLLTLLPPIIPILSIPDRLYHEQEEEDEANHIKRTGSGAPSGNTSPSKVS